MAGLFLSNSPEALSSSANTLAQRWTRRRICLMWFALMVTTAVGSGLGFLLATVLVMPFESTRHGFLGLLLCMVSVLVIVPFFQDWPEARVILTLFFTLVLLFSLVPFFKSTRQSLSVAVVLAVPTLLVNWGTILSPEFWEFFPGIENIPSMLFFGYILVVLFIAILRARKITTNLIFCSVCIYLLIGLEWAFVYSLLEHTTPGSFQGNMTGFSDASQRGDWLFLHFLYYSYTTLTTLGYGDIAPRTSPAQMISSLEAITGQFYLAILVARLIGIHLINASKP